MNSQHYADDTVLISDLREELEALLDNLVIENGKRGLSINCKNAECMVISKRSDIPDCQLLIGGIGAKQLEKSSYLRGLITSDGKCDSEVKKKFDCQSPFLRK